MNLVDGFAEKKGISLLNFSRPPAFLRIAFSPRLDQQRVPDSPSLAGPFFIETA